MKFQGIPYGEWKAQLASAVGRLMPDAQRDLANDVARLTPELSTVEQGRMPAVAGRTAADLAEMVELRKQMAQLTAGRIVQEAKVFVTSQITAGRAYPAEQAALLTLYVGLAQHDLTNPPEAGEPSGVAALTALQSARPSGMASVMSQQLLPTAPPHRSQPLTSAVDDLTQLDASVRAWAGKKSTE